MSILKIGTHGILEVLIPNPDLDFWNPDPEILFWANIGPKIQSCPFCLKIDSHSITRMPIPNPELDFWNFDLKIHFWASLDPKSQSSPFCLKIGTHGISRRLILIPILFQILISFLGKFGPKKSKLSVLTESTHMVSWKCRIRIRRDFWNSDPKIHFWANFCRKS